MNQLSPLTHRPRRNRKSEAVRALVEETKVTTDDLIFPLFLIEGKNQRSAVASMPGIYRLSVDLMLMEIEECLKLGLRAFDIFPAVEDKWKDKTATKSYNPNFFYLKA
ncbi:MAG: porphobilinogen synthase, partial [Cyclobacteriaceae bacterium]|nr:porphobilinogen synthase [Cyclobacteriaceae bacterium]